MEIVLWILYNMYVLPMIYTISMFYQWFTSTHSWNFAFKAQITALQQAIKAKTSNSKRTELQADFHLFLESALGFYMQVNHVMVDKYIADLVLVYQINIWIGIQEHHMQVNTTKATVRLYSGFTVALNTTREKHTYKLWLGEGWRFVVLRFSLVNKTCHWSSKNVNLATGAWIVPNKAVTSSWHL